MSRAIDLLRRFRKDESGAFLVLFAVLAIVLIATSGAVVDFTAMQQSRTRAQTALDSAALALQPRIKLDSVATLKTKAQAIVTERVNDANVTVSLGTPVVNTSEGTLELTASVSKPTSFVRLVGVNSITANLVSQATRKQLDLEVAMVLDNSGSMANSSRMVNLIKAGRCATNILFSGYSDCTDTGLITGDAMASTNSNVKVAIIPFDEFVKVGTGYKTATWMDQTGKSSVAKSGFDDDDDYQTTFSANVNRFDLYTKIGVTWSGCVEARAHTTGAGGLYYDTSDLTPDATVPDSLFVPVFAPDQYSGRDNSYISDAPSACPAAPTYTVTRVRTKCNTAADTQTEWSNATCSGGTDTTSYSQTVAGVTTVSASSPPTLLHISPPSTYTTTYSYAQVGFGTYKYTITRTRVYDYGPFPDRVLGERLCKYVSGTTVTGLGSGPGGKTGPNADCPTASMLPLTATKTSVTSKVKAMQSDGGTNIHQGVMWGFHALSSTEPLTEAKTYDAATSKVMIVMTDGENTHSSNGDLYGADWYVAYSYPLYGRLGAVGDTTAALQTEMDNRTKTTCTNAKAKGIVIYTVGLSPPNQSTKDMLTACATESSKAYFPTNSADLVNVFKEIAGQLADLRLAK